MTTTTDHTTTARTEVRALSDAGKHVDAADRWIRHLAELKEAAYVEWGKTTIGDDTLAEHYAREAAFKSHMALIAFTSAARVDASKAVGALVSGWSV